MYVKAVLLLLVVASNTTHAQRAAVAAPGVLTARPCYTPSIFDSNAVYITGKKEEVYTNARDKAMKAGIVQNQYLEVVAATSQDWIAGARGGGRGTTYKLHVKITTDKEIEFDSIWIAGKKLAIKPVKDAALKWDKNDVVTLLASYYKGDPGKAGRKEEERNSPPADSVKAPVEYKGAALLKYKIGGGAQYAEVPDITVLPAVYGQ